MAADSIGSRRQHQHLDEQGRAGTGSADDEDRTFNHPGEGRDGGDWLFPLLRLRRLLALRRARGAAGLDGPVACLRRAPEEKDHLLERDLDADLG